MEEKLSENAVSLVELGIDPGRVVRHAADTHRPVLLTHDGQGVAVLQSLGDYEATVAERAFMRAVVAGLADLESGREVSLADAKKRLGPK